MGKTERALEDVKRVLRLDPDFEPAMELHARLITNEGKDLTIDTAAGGGS